MSQSQFLDREEETTAASEPESSFGDILNQFEQSHEQMPESGDQGREATVVSVKTDLVFLDVGLKTEGILPVMSVSDAVGAVTVKAGDVIRVAINGRDEQGYYRLSLIHVETPKDWSGLKAAFEEKRTVTGLVTGAVKGGLAIDVGARAFLPASRSGVRETADLPTLIGQQITCRIIKIDEEKDDVVVDRRVILEEEEKHAKEQRFHDLHEGMVVRGTVRNLLDYGAFVDIGGVDGMLHVAEISRARVAKPADILKIGEAVDVKIIKVDTAKKRISLSMKALQADPWASVAEKYIVGERVKGTVSRLADFGAFIELEPAVDGLVHLSELSWSKKVRKPSDLLKEGDAVEVVVLGVHPVERRISLGLKQALGDPWADAGERFKTGTIVEVPVVSLTKFGAFVQLDEHIEGMIHVGDMSLEKRVEHPQDVVKLGETVRAVVLEIDVPKRRLRLGMKQLQPTSADEYIAEHKAGDAVTGRVIDVSRGRASVELGEGVKAYCKLESEKEESKQESSGVDLSALSSMLASKWKSGGGATGGSGREVLRSGQVRNFKITKLDPEQKRIEVELVS